jgi:hypothetical protein
LPSVDPAFDLAGLLDELDARVEPALLSVAFEGLDDFDDDFAMMHSFLLNLKQVTRDESRRGYRASRVEKS